MKLTNPLLAGLCVLAASSLQSRASLDITGWSSAGTVTEGVAAWTYQGSDLPGTWNVTFDSFDNMVIQGSAGNALHDGQFYLNYSVELSPGLGFTGVTVDSTWASGNTVVTKDVYSDSALSTLVASASSVDGTASALQAISGSPTTLWVRETIDISNSGSLLGFGNRYTVVPEASTVLAGMLLLIPLGISTARIVRRNRAA